MHSKIIHILIISLAITFGNHIIYFILTYLLHSYGAFCSLDYILLQKNPLSITSIGNIIHHSGLNSDSYFSITSFESIGISAWLKIPSTIDTTIVKLVDIYSYTTSITTLSGNVHFFTVTSQYENGKWGYIFAQVNYLSGENQLYYIGLNGLGLCIPVNALNPTISAILIQDIYVGGDASSFCSCSLNQVYLIPNNYIVSNSQIYSLAGGDIYYYIWYSFSNPLSILNISGYAPNITNNNNAISTPSDKVSDLIIAGSSFTINSTYYASLIQQNPNWFTSSYPSLTLSFHFRIDSYMVENQLPILSRNSNGNYIFILNMNLLSGNLDHLSVSINNNAQTSTFQTGYYLTDYVWHHCIVQVICVTGSNGALQYAKVDNLESAWITNNQIGYTDLTADFIWIGKTDLPTSTFHWEIKDFIITRGTFKSNLAQDCNSDLGSTLIWGPNPNSLSSSTLNCLSCPANFCMDISTTTKITSCFQLSSLPPCSNDSYDRQSSFILCEDRCNPYTRGYLSVSPFDTLDIYLTFSFMLGNNNIQNLNQLLQIEINDLTNYDFSLNITQISLLNITIRLNPNQIINKNILTVTIKDPSSILDIDGMPLFSSSFNITLGFDNPIANMGLNDKDMILVGTAVIIGSLPLIFSGVLCGLWGLIDTLQYLFYFIYLNMNVPIEFKKFIIYFKIATLPLPNIPMMCFNILPKLQAPQIFDEFNIDALFLRNGLVHLFYTIMCFVCVAIALIAEKILIQKSGSDYVRKIVKITKWNFPLRYILINMIQLAFAIFLQFTNITMESGFYIASIIIAILSFLFSLLFIIWAFRQTTTKLFINNRSTFNQLYGSLTDEFVNNDTENVSFVKRNFNIINAIRKIVYIFGFVILYDYVIINLISIMIQSLIMEYLLYKYSPYLRKSINIKNIIEEVIFFLIAFLLLLIERDVINPENIIKITDYCLVLLTFICFIYNLAFVIIDYIKATKELILSIKNYFRKNCKKYKKPLPKNHFQIVPEISGFVNSALNIIQNDNNNLSILNNNNRTEQNLDDNNSPSRSAIKLFDYGQDKILAQFYL